MSDWAALFRNGTKCYCASLLNKRVTLRHDSLTLGLISFSLLQPSPAIRLFWLFPLRHFLIDWTSRSYTLGYFLWANFITALKNSPISILKIIRRRKSKTDLGPLNTIWVPVKKKENSDDKQYFWLTNHLILILTSSNLLLSILQVLICKINANLKWTWYDITNWVNVWKCKCQLPWHYRLMF